MYDELDPNRARDLGICDLDDPMTMADLQRMICSFDHDESRKPDYFYKLAEEVGELSASMRKDVRWDEDDPSTFKGSVEEEIGDVVYYAIAIANLYHVDLARCMREKEKLNAEKYDREIVIR